MADLLDVNRLETGNRTQYRPSSGQEIPRRRPKIAFAA